MNRPLLPPALAFGTGILANEFLGRPPGLWLAFLVVAFGLALAPGRAGIPALWTGWILAGALAHAIHDTPLSALDLRRVAGVEPRLVELRGRIAETPSLRLKERRGRWSGRTLASLKVTSWRDPSGTWSSATGTVMTSTRGMLPSDLFRGRAVRVTGVLQVPPGPAAPGLFDYRQHLRHQDIFRFLDVTGVEDWIPESGPTPHLPLSERFLPWAQEALAHGLPDDEATRLIWAMTLGWRTGLAGDSGTVFMESGTMHVFAISGLHIALIATLLCAGLRAVRVPRAVTGLLIIPIMWFYVAATGWQSSAVRSAVMMTTITGTWILNRPSDILNSLALSALVILVWQPGQLMLTGFQLSFGVVAGLALLVPVLEPRLFRALQFRSDPMLPDALRPRWSRNLDRPARWLASALATGIAAFLSSLPFTVETFHLFSPVSLVANLFVVPLSGLALSANAVSLLVTVVSKDLAALFNASAWVWMRGMMALSHAFAAIPGGVWYVASPPWPWWIPYAGILAAVAGLRLRIPHPSRWMPGVAVALGIAAAVEWSAGRGKTSLLVLPGGDAIVVDAPGWRQDLLLNAGSETTGPSVVVPLLHSLGWNRIPTLILAQADAPRVGGAPRVVQEFRPDELVIGSPRLRSPAFRDALETADSLRISIRRIHDGLTVSGWSVLWPPVADVARSAEEAAPVLSRTIGGPRILLLPSVGRKTQAALLKAHAGTGRLRADILVAGVSRDPEPLLPDLIAAIRPQCLVISSAPASAGTPIRSGFRTGIEDAGISVFSTGDHGALTLELGHGRAELRSMDGIRRVWEASRESTANTTFPIPPASERFPSDRTSDTPEAITPP